MKKYLWIVLLLSTNALRPMGEGLEVDATSQDVNESGLGEDQGTEREMISEEYDERYGSEWNGRTDKQKENMNTDKNNGTYNKTSLTIEGTRGTGNTEVNTNDGPSSETLTKDANTSAERGLSFDANDAFNRLHGDKINENYDSQARDLKNKKYTKKVANPEYDTEDKGYMEYREEEDMMDVPMTSEEASVVRSEQRNKLELSRNKTLNNSLDDFKNKYSTDMDQFAAHYKNGHEALNSRISQLPDDYGKEFDEKAKYYQKNVAPELLEGPEDGDTGYFLDNQSDIDSFNNNKDYFTDPKNRETYVKEKAEVQEPRMRSNFHNSIEDDYYSKLPSTLKYESYKDPLRAAQKSIEKEPFDKAHKNLTRLKGEFNKDQPNLRPEHVQAIKRDLGTLRTQLQNSLHTEIFNSPEDGSSFRSGRSKASRDKWMAQKRAEVDQAFPGDLTPKETKSKSIIENNLDTLKKYNSRTSRARRWAGKRYDELTRSNQDSTYDSSNSDDDDDEY